MQTIPVIPTRNRPSTAVNGEKSESSFTTLYRKIRETIRAFQRLDLPNTPNNEPARIALRKELRDYYASYIKVESKAMKAVRGGRADNLKTLKVVMDGKGGYWHKNVMSSRVNNSGRTVIVGDNGIKPNEVRIPKYMAEKFRIPLEITISNKDKAEELLQKGIIKQVTVMEGQKKKIDINDNNRASIRLAVGDIAYRRMMTGDITAINRQPTLHRWSFMAMKVVVSENEEPGREVNAIGMNTIYVSGYNADFDGDEVHVHVPASIHARAEAAALMSVERAPISDQTSQNIYGLIQNTVWGAYEMSKHVENLDREAWYDMTRSIQDFEGPSDSDKPNYALADRIHYIETVMPVIYARNGIKGRSVYNTASLISLAFPSNFSYRRPIEKEDAIYIENGILISGTLTKSIVGAGRRSIIQTLFRSHGSEAIVIYAHVMQQVTAAWMQTQGRFTVSLTDFAPGQDLEEQMENFKDESLRAVKEISQRNTEGIFNRDVLIAKLRDEWLKVPAAYEGVVTKQTVGRLINEIVFILFDTMHLERNLYYRGRTTVLYRPEKIREVLQKAISTVLPADGLQKQTLVARLKAGPPNPETLRLLAEFSAYLLNHLTPLVERFIEAEMTNPLDPEAVEVRSIHQIATIEADILDELDRMRGAGIKMLLNPNRPMNSLDSAIQSGARGNDGNLVQSKFALGQQTISGARLKESISNGRRVLPFFLENDPDPAARGYVRSSLFRGLTPTEYFSAAAPARQTQTDTAFKTGETGYMQKRLMAYCGDFIVQEDGTVRDERGNIVTFAYGGHYFDPSRMVRLPDRFSFVDIEAINQQVRAEENSAQDLVSHFYSQF